MRRLLCVAAGVLALAAPAAACAATIAVDTTSDAMAADAHCSLREAITAANTDNFPEPGPNECPKGDGADTITLGPGSYEFTRAGASEDFNATGDLDITGATTIAGAGALLSTIDAKQLDRVFDVRSGGSLTLSGVTVTGGRAPNGTNGASHSGGPGAIGTGDDATPGEDGGGIRSAGPLVLTDCIVTGNQAGTGGNGGTGTGGNADPGATGGAGHGGAAGNGGDGGGIWTTDDLTLTRVIVSSNGAGDGGHGGLGQGGMGGFASSGTAGQGGAANGGGGGFGGNGGGVFVGGTGVAKIDSSSFHANAAGDAGTGGTGTGGLGGTAGGTPSNGGPGGPASGGAGEQGGVGGAIEASRVLTLTRSLVDGNAAGLGGPGGAATAGAGGATTNGNGGRGGDATGGSSVGGGATGGVDSPAGVISDTTFTGNHSGAATVGGAATGGKGGNGTSAGGAGGNADAGFGGNGGYVGAIGANDTTIVHVTIIGNTLGAGGAAATATGGAGGSPGGSSGSASPGLTGSVSTGSAIYPNGTTPLRNSIVAGNDPHACVAGVTDGGHNVSFGDTSCPGANADPLLGPLADNGGPTLTFRPKSGSPVIDAVPAGGAGCTATDQRGAARPGGAGCDIGAYEIAPPALALGELGSTVHGTVDPNARSTTYHFEYGTTTAYGSSTAEGSLPAGDDAVAVSAVLDGLAPGTTYHVRLVATNADGTNATADGTFTTSSQGTGGSRDTTAPVILSASVKPKTFRRKHGTTFRYKLSEPAKVVFTIQRRKGKRYVKATRFSKASKAGANIRKFRTRKLRPGRYRATLVATDAAGNRSKARRVTFRVKR